MGKHAFKEPTAKQLRILGAVAAGHSYSVVAASERCSRAFIGQIVARWRHLRYRCRDCGGTFDAGHRAEPDQIGAVLVCDVCYRKTA